ncbi:copper resistance protein CopC [Streptomyces sp. B6B3]|uniref:copper resistance CopC/CopD family protein n=1 Tax=Streptomyces sp. B6B3 TaxID=3153570 RepID=UPI00325EBE91
MTPVTASRPPRSRAAALLLAAAAALASLLIAAPSAAAHATLTGSSPADGEVVATAPERVTLSFSEQVALADDAIRVLDPEGRPVTTGEPTDVSTGDAVRHAIALRDGLARGTYTVAWHVVSADSHPISGAFTFSVGAPSATSAEVPDVSGDDGLVGLLHDITRYASYAGFLVLAGGGAFVLRCWPPAAGLRTAQRVLLAGWTTLTAATLCQLLLRTPYTGSGRLADALDLTGLRDVVETTTGTSLLTRLLLLAAAGAFVAVLTGPYARLRAAGEDQARVRDLSFGLGTGGAIVAAGIAATWAMAEHASTGPQTSLAVPADALHLMAAAAWIGGLAMLLVLLRNAPLAVPASAVRRFSGLALASVVTLAATGVYQSWRQVRTVSGLTDTDFGRLLLLKVALVAALLGVASFSRRFTARLADAAPGEGAATPAPAAATAALTATGSAPAAGPASSSAAAGEAADEAAGGVASVRDAAVSPARAAQLARQRDAVRQARQRRARDADPTRRALRRSVLAEAAVAAVVLGVTTVLTTTTPARTEAAALEDAVAEQPGQPGADDAAGETGPFTAEVPYDTGGSSGQGVAEVQLSPASTGANTLHITLLDPEGRSATAVEIGVALTLPAESIGPLSHTAQPLSDDHWAVTDIQLPRPGDWELALTIRTSDIDQVTETTTVPIR